MRTELLTTRQVSKESGRSVWTVARHVKAGRLKAAVDAPPYVFHRKDVDAYLASEPKDAS